MLVPENRTQCGLSRHREAALAEVSDRDGGTAIAYACLGARWTFGCTEQLSPARRPVLWQ